MARRGINSSGLSGVLRRFHVGSWNLQGGLKSNHDISCVVGDLANRKIIVGCLQETHCPEGLEAVRPGIGRIICLADADSTPPTLRYGLGFFIGEELLEYYYDHRLVSNRIAVLRLRFPYNGARSRSLGGKSLRTAADLESLRTLSSNRTEWKRVSDQILSKMQNTYIARLRIKQDRSRLKRMASELDLETRPHERTPKRRRRSSEDERQVTDSILETRFPTLVTESNSNQATSLDSNLRRSNRVRKLTSAAQEYYGDHEDDEDSRPRKKSRKVNRTRTRTQNPRTTSCTTFRRVDVESHIAQGIELGRDA
jgi:hypothetical protein